ncbi:MAG: hypothetical protein FWB72_02025 [Firmicutes bacterium]|nr:hypothetical protein [Bacillota bacterium]
MRFKQNFNELVLKRNSIRKYDFKAQLTKDELAEIENLLVSLPRLHKEEGEFSFKIIDKHTYDTTTGGKFKIQSPHYIMFYGDKSCDKALQNIGYVGQLLCLELVAIDIGSVWLGGTVQKVEQTDTKGEFIICIGFGRKAEDESFGVNANKRKKLDAVAEYDKNLENNPHIQLLENARLAASAMNLQPWFFVSDLAANKIHVYRKDPKILKVLKLPATLITMQKIDIGIAIAHFASTEFTTEQNVAERKGYVYETTLVF